MGIYDRNYYREDDQRPWFGGRTLVVNVIIANVAVLIADLLFNHQISDFCELQPDLFQKPWQCWQLVTYGFVHDPHDLRHILFNMYFLYLFGMDVEVIYGRAEFLRIYLVAIVLAGLAWVAFMAGGESPPLVGASGGIMGIMILFVLHFPRRTFLLMFILPVPAWALGGLYVLGDLSGLGDPRDQVAHVAHLAGAAFGAIYYQTGMNFGRMIPRRLSGSMFRLRPRLRIHNPSGDDRDLSEKVDEILEKISREGEASLSKQERRTLEEASRRYQRRRE